MKPLKLGLWGARADTRGLAQQTEAFARHMFPERIMGFDLTADNASPYDCDWDGYMLGDRNVDMTICKRSDVTEGSARTWLRGLDIVFGAETFYQEHLVDWAREEGVKSVLIINPEFAPWYNPQLVTSYTKPDVCINPTNWLEAKLPGVVHLPFPVDRKMFPFRQRSQANHFVHTAGHPAMGDRAGTRLVIGSLPRLSRDITVTIRSQSPLPYTSRATQRHAVNIDVQNYASPTDLYADADVVVVPRRYGGQHLGVNEALSSGCPVIMLAREPETQWGGVSTIPARRRRSYRTQLGLIDGYDAAPLHLTNLMTKLHNTPNLVSQLSEDANRYADTISWDTLLPRYHDFFRSVLFV